MQSQSRVDTAWFHGRLHDRKISQRRLAQMLELDPAAVSLMLRGRRKMSAAEAAEIARMLGVSVDEVLARAGAGAPAKRAAGSAEPVVAAPQPAEASAMLTIPVPLSNGATANLNIPRVLTKADADRIAALVAAFAVP